tara:strand:+ start:15403 stop:17889 length:2487 start_codon:yes stop_codon:yes gene_type:complete
MKAFLQRTKSITSRLAAATLASLGIGICSSQADDDNDDRDDGHRHERYFQRIATFPIFLNTDVELETVAEIVAATDDGNTLVYTDSEQGLVGFVDISDPADPQPAGTVEVGGEPTSVGVAQGHVLVAVVTTPEDEEEPFLNPQGELKVFSLATKEEVASFDLGGQPDAVAVSPDQRYAAVAIENERDEDLGDGRPGQEGNPPGMLVVIDLGTTDPEHPATWTASEVDLVGIADLFPEDPEPEFVDINEDNIAVVTLQENNHLVLVDLEAEGGPAVIADFSGGTVDLDLVDTLENDLIQFTDSLTDVPREADAVSWITSDLFVTADEGDLDGGSRGFTIYSTDGSVVFTSGNNDDHLVASLGHYPEGRSENKGNEPEGVTFGEYGPDRFLFVGSERSSVISVYCLPEGGESAPELRQVLPAGLAPEGLLAIPGRDLFVVASEDDDRGDKYRSSISIYALTSALPTYPTITSLDREDGTPIPWGALSALAADPADANRAWTVYDSFYKESRILTLDLDGAPAYITDDFVIHDSHRRFQRALRWATWRGQNPDLDPDALRNEDETVNLDPEGLAVREDGGFWVASEGNGTVGDAERPIKSLNWLFKVDETGAIRDVVSLPWRTNRLQVRFGFEGVTSVGSGRHEVVYVCFQREWAGDPDGYVRIGRYETRNRSWKFFYYPLDAPESPNGGWVGLSEIVALNADTFLILERDNQAGTDAAVKRIYATSVAGVRPRSENNRRRGFKFPVLSKVLVRDILDDLAEPNGAIIEKVEGLTILADGEVLIVTDNDGVDDSSGETQLINLGDLIEDDEEEDDERPGRGRGRDREDDDD